MTLFPVVVHVLTLLLPCFLQLHASIHSVHTIR